ncbi:MAG: DEAD/DEAH box helicase family protein [Rickettsiales bacterium]|nr:DEAD/DEAH box helicase family protein [Rickettsiales bacterium]
MPSSNFRTKILKKSDSLEEYAIYKAALEWDVVEPIVIDSKADVQSEKKWRDLVEPYHHQITNLITFCRRLPVTLLSDDVGLGKTISAGLIASELISRNRISKILIICPKILRDQWKEELETKFNIPAVVIKSGEHFVKECREKKKGAIIATYTTGSLHLDKIQQGDFDMLILDEAHKLRNLYGVIDTPQVAKNFSKALSERLFKYVLMLTATPIQNRLWDMYSLVDLLTVARGHTNPFGSPEIFARRFIGDSRTQARRLKPEMTNEFRSIVYGYMSRVRREDAKLYFPDRVVQIHLVEPTPEELYLIKTCKNNYLI